MIVNRFEILSLDGEAANARIAVQRNSDLANQILDESRVVVSALRYVLLIDALEQAVDFARRAALGDRNQLAGRDSGSTAAWIASCMRNLSGHCVSSPERVEAKGPPALRDDFVEPLRLALL